MMPDSPKAPPVDLQQVAGRVTAATGEPTSATDLERIMASLQSVSSFWETVALSGRTAAQVAAALRELAAEDVVAFDAQKVALTPGGLALAWQHSLVPRKLYRCPHCEGRGLALTIFQRTQARYEQVLEEWRNGGRGDGNALTPTAVIALVAFLADRGDLMGKDILVEGDAALTGVALALSGFPKRIVTLEREPERAAFMREAAGRNRIKLDVTEGRVEGLPDELTSAFSTAVLTSLGPASIAVATALRGPGAALAGLWSHAGQSLTALGAMEAEAQRSGLVLTDFIRDFAAFEPALHPHFPHEDAPEALRQPPTAVWHRPAVVRFELFR